MQWKKELTRRDTTSHRTQALFFHRLELLRFLYTSLPSDVQKRLIPGKAVTNIQTTADGNRVAMTCADGTIEKGDMVVGADGVHSKVREIITRRKSVAAEVASTTERNKPFVARFRCLFGYSTLLCPASNRGIYGRCTSRAP